MLTSYFRTGPSTEALSTKEGRVLSSFVRSCTVLVFNHQNGQTAPYIALLRTFGVIPSVGQPQRGLHSDASRGGLGVVLWS